MACHLIQIIQIENSNFQVDLTEYPMDKFFIQKLILVLISLNTPLYQLINAIQFHSNLQSYFLFYLTVNPNFQSKTLLLAEINYHRIILSFLGIASILFEIDFFNFNQLLFQDQIQPQNFHQTLLRRIKKGFQFNRLICLILYCHCYLYLINLRLQSLKFMNFNLLIDLISPQTFHSLFNLSPITLLQYINH